MPVISRLSRIGIALGAERATAVLPRTATTVSVACTITNESDATALAAVLRELQTALSNATGQSFARGEVDLALLPPLSEVRVVSLPPVRPAEALAVLQRDAARHFVGGTIARTIAVQLGARKGSSAQPTLVAAAATNLLEQIDAAAHAIGWRVRKSVPGVAAWNAAAPSNARENRLIIAQTGSVLHVLRTGAGELQLRRVPADELADVVGTAGTGPGKAWIWAEADVRPELERALAAVGWAVQATQHGADPALAAAHNAGAAALALVPQSRAVTQAHRQRTLATRIALAAVVLLIAAGLVELWGQQRELSAIRARRAEIRKQVSPLIALRDSVMQLGNETRRIEDLRTGLPRFTAALVDLATLLPEDTHVTSVHATGDTIVVEAAGANAGAALQAIRASNVLRDVRLRGAVERQLEEGSTSAERFTFAARIPDQAVKAAAPPRKLSTPRRSPP